MRLIGYAALLALLPLTAAQADVVINEIFYNAPDDQDNVQWIELHNTASQAADVGGWRLDEGELFVFSPGATLAPRGYLVVALDPTQFARIYDQRALGPLKRALKRGGEKIELHNARGDRVDIARYNDREPWPVSADGYSASLERICPGASGESAENWAASPLPRATPRPAGTPGKANASFAAVLPPVIHTVRSAPEALLPGQPLTVEAEVKTTEEPREVALLYRVVTDRVEGREAVIPMTRDPASGRFQARVPGQEAGALVRYRLRAVSKSGARRVYPAENDLRPALSAFVQEKRRPAPIPFGFLLRGGADVPGPGQPEVPEEPSPGRPVWESGPGDPPAGFRGLPAGFDGPMGGLYLGLFGPWGDVYSFMDEDAPPPKRAPRGGSTFVYQDPASGKSVIYDYIHAVSRARGPMYRGYKLFFHKDRPLAGMSAVNLVLEGCESFLMAEPLAYDLYRRAGSPAPLTEFVRLWVDGSMQGYHLMVERPNRSFLRRNQRNDEGDLYKLIWYGDTLVEQHPKKTNTRAGHEDLITLVDRLRKIKGDEQWKLIEKSFNVDQVATYFAVNMVLSHWDGFFNNYFAYHDTQDTKKWEIYPWDQDKTGGYHDGLSEEDVFFDMPLNFGMDGALPPPRREGEESWYRFGNGPMWWRPPGYFSGPLLANARFRRIFLVRTKEIVERIYTPEIYFPLIDAMADRLREDVILRARARGEDSGAAMRALARNAALLKTHVFKRRQFLLDQPELRALSQEATTQAGRPSPRR
jgi:hypothetical protein